MFFRFAKSFFKKPSAKILGISLLTTIPFITMNSYQMTTDATIPPVTQQLQSNKTSIQFPTNEQYYLVVYDSERKELVNVVKAILKNEKQKIIFVPKDEYEKITQQQLHEHLTIFFKGNHVPYKIQLDLQKGEVIQQAKNIKQFVSEISSIQQMMQLMNTAKNSFDDPLMIVNVYNKQGYSILQSQIQALVQLHILNPLIHKVHIMRNNDKQKAQNTYHILRNDILNQITGEFEFQTFKNPQKFDQQSLIQTRNQFIQFMLPKIHTIRNFDGFSLYQQRRTVDPQKYTLSIKIKPHDKLSKQKLKVIGALYEKYGSRFNFAVFTTTKFKPILLHTNETADDFVLFNYQKTIPSNIIERPTYQKLFLGNYNSQISSQDNINIISASLDKFLNGEVKANTLNVVPQQKYFQINLSILKNKLKDTTQNPFVLGVCQQKCQNSEKRDKMKYWIDYKIHNIGFVEETYLKIDPKNKVVEPYS